MKTVDVIQVISTASSNIYADPNDTSSAGIIKDGGKYEDNRYAYILKRTYTHIYGENELKQSWYLSKYFYRFLLNEKTFA